MALLLPISRGRLEANLVGHVLVQMPLLASSGWFLGSALEPKFDKVMERWNRFGVAGLTLTIFTALFWVVPRSVDGAVALSGYEAFKFVSLPGAGAALVLSLPRTHPLFAGALKANFVSMMAILAWVYTAAPVRLCNSYLVNDQKILGAGMAILAWCSPSIGGSGSCLEPRVISYFGMTAFDINLPGRAACRFTGCLLWEDVFCTARVKNRGHRCRLVGPLVP